MDSSIFSRRFGSVGFTSIFLYGEEYARSSSSGHSRSRQVPTPRASQMDSSISSDDSAVPVFVRASSAKLVSQSASWDLRFERSAPFGFFHQPLSSSDLQTSHLCHLGSHHDLATWIIRINAFDFRCTFPLASSISLRLAQFSFFAFVGLLAKTTGYIGIYPPGTMCLGTLVIRRVSMGAMSLHRPNSLRKQNPF